jgi:hypothetical protein
MVTFTGSLLSSDDDETAIRDAYVELHLDGSAFAAVPITDRTDDDPTSRGIGEITLVDDSILLVDLLARWMATRAGVWGTATLTLGLTDPSTPDGSLNEAVEFVRAEDGPVRRMRGTRRLTGDVRSSVAVDLAAVDSLQQRLVVSYEALSGLLQWFGLPEPTQLLPDGMIVPSEFLMSRYRQVVQWARDNGIACKTLRGT